MFRYNYSNMKTKLDQFEARLQMIIESSVDLLPSSLRKKTLAQRLINTVRASLPLEASDIPAQSFKLTIHLNPDELANWKNNQEFISLLMETIQNAIEDQNPELSLLSTILLDGDSSVPLGEFRIDTKPNSEYITQTAVMLVSHKEDPATYADPHPENAFLILDNSNTVPLRQTVINIGRRLNNHIILEDPRVSRNHAQLRAIRGKYVLFDLNATGGTFVNGERVTQHTLKPGDVISLAGVPLVYGEEYKSSMSETGEYAPEPQDLI